MYGDKYYRFGTGGILPPAIKNLLFANGIIYLMMVLNSSLSQFMIYNFGLNRYDLLSNYKFWQLATYMFLHDPGNIFHVGLNMLFLWMFGADLEREWGTREFLKYYFITGIGAGVLNVVFSPALTIGASGAVYGIMLAYALRYPNRLIYIYFLFPVKIKYFVAFLTLISFFSTFGSSGDGVAHAAHLGGILIGYIYLKYWYLFYKIRNLFSGSFKQRSSSKMKYSKGGENKTEYYRHIIDDLLDKINRVGYLNLTEEEKRLLEEGSNYLREHDKENYN